MQLQSLTKAQLLEGHQQQVMQNTSYIPPRRNIIYSTLPHTSARTVFLSNDVVGIIQNNPKSADSGPVIPGRDQHALPVDYDIIPIPNEDSQVTGLRQTRATLSINNDTLNISDDTVTQNIYLNNSQIPLRNN